MPEGGEAKHAEFTAHALPHLDSVYSAALYLTRDQDDAADLAQDTFLRAYRSWDQFTPGTNCKAWLLTILHNAFRNRYRAARRLPRTVEFDEHLYSDEQRNSPLSPGADPADVLGAQVLDSEVEAALKSLPDEFRDVVILVDLEELTYEEAAAAMDCPIGTIRSRLSRGRRLLQQALYQYAKDRGIVSSSE